MRKGERLSGCAACRVSRRGFLAAGCAAACAGLAGLAAPARRVRAAEAGRKLRVRVIYALHGPKQEVPDWPNKGFDFGPQMEAMDAALHAGCPDAEFIRTLATGKEQADKILADDATANIDGYVVCQMNCWNPVAQSIVPSGKPVLYTSMPYGGSGGFLVYTASFLRNAAPNVGFVTSSRPEDLAAAAKCFDVVRSGGSPSEFAAATQRVRLERTAARGDLTCTPDPVKALGPDECIKRLRASKILAVNDPAGPAGPPFLEIPLEQVPFAELNDAWQKADQDEARAVADRWQKDAAAVVDVPREVLEQSAAMYLAEKAVMAARGANAITINCLGGFYGGHIHAYPCLGFHELCNEGLIGACECDVASTASMVLVNVLTGGRPGYISDPVMDSSKRQIIYAHCVASNRAFGPEGAKNSYEILTHSEDRQGASVRSILPVGYRVTSIQVSPARKEVLFHQGKAVANDPDDRACRTKLAAEPLGDFEKLFTQWDQWGWHRVTCYGDLKEPVFAVADALGYKVVEEA